MEVLFNMTMEELIAENERLKMEAILKDKELLAKQAMIDDQKLRIDYLTADIAIMRDKKYGKSSEKLGKRFPDLFNYETFNEAEENTNPNEPEPSFDETEEKTVSFKVKNKKNKNLINRIKNIETQEIIHDLPEDEKICKACGSQMELIGYNTVEKLHYVPSKLKKVIHKYPKYMCKPCNEDEITNVVTSKCELPFPKTMIDSSIVANIMVEKYVKHVPLYRQEKLFKNIGLDVSRINLSNWFLAGADYLKPLFDLMHKDIKQNDIVLMDETTLNVLEIKNREKCYIWVMNSSKYDIPIKLYFYRENHKHKNIPELLEGAKVKYIQSDAYDGYTKLDGVTSVFCNAHSKRKYADIVKISNVVKAKGNTIDVVDNLAAQGVTYINRLYSVERRLAKKGAGLDEIYEVRNTESKAILDEYKDWLEEYVDVIPPKSKLGEAMAYSYNHFEELSNYLLDARLNIDNNASERMAKVAVLGRKNWLFCDTVRGAEGTCTALSVIETALANNLNVFEYLQYVLDRIYVTDTTDEEALRKLLPYSTDLPNYLKVKKSS